MAANPDPPSRPPAEGRMVSGGARRLAGDAALGVEDGVVPLVEVGDALAGLFAGQHIGAQRDHRAPAEARVPRAVVGGRAGELGRPGSDREARVPQRAVAALAARAASSGSKRSAAASGASAGSNSKSTRLPAASRPPTSRPAAVRRSRSRSHCVGHRVVHDPASAPCAEGVEGHEDRGQLAPAAQDDRHVRARSPVDPRLDRLSEAHARGTSSRTRVPPAAPGPTASRPPIDAARSRMSARPKCPSPGPPSSSGAEAAAVVLDGEGQRRPARRRGSTTTWPARAWRSTLASASPSTRRTTATTSGSVGSTAARAVQLDGQAALARALARAPRRRRAGRRSARACERSSSRARTMRCAAPTASRRRARLSPACVGAGIGVQQRDLALGQREVLGQAVVDVGRQAQALALDLGARDALAQARGGDARPSRSPRMASTVALVSSSASGWRCAAATTPRTSSPASSGSTSHAEAGGSNGLATSQVAGSWKTSGPPAGRGQPPRLLLEAQLVEQRDRVDVRRRETAKRRRMGTSSASGR